MKIIFLILFFGVVFFYYVRFLEKKTAFYPEKDIVATPQDINLDFVNVDFMSSELKLHGWFVPHPEATKTVVYLHGNAGNISGRLERISVFHDLKFNTFIFDYRGYGLSEGAPTEDGVYADAMAAYKYLIEKMEVKPADIIVYGASLGGAVAVDLASKIDCHAVVLDSTFTSGVDIGRRIYPFVPGFLISFRFDSLSKIEKVTQPKLFIHSKDDQVIPINFGIKLYEAAGAPKEFVRMEGDHVSAHLQDQERFKKSFLLFLEGIN